VKAKSWLSQFGAVANTRKDQTPVERAELLESDGAIGTLHDDATRSAENQTDRGRGPDEDIITHFVALVHSAGVLYECDGRKGAPVAHGATTPAALLRDASCRVVRDAFMARDPDEIRFTILALAPNTDFPDDEE
jgi:ubiquitin carboxyl-terminal hydrolase L3